MPRGKRIDDGHEANRAVRGAEAGAAGSHRGVSGVPTVSEVEDRLEAAHDAFKEILFRTDGWLRCIPCGEGKLNYFKYKFSNGEHKGKYVMYVGAYNDWTASLLGLAEKLAAVDAGALKPAHDTFYDPR